MSKEPYIYEKRPTHMISVIVRVGGGEMGTEEWVSFVGLFGRSLL